MKCFCVEFFGFECNSQSISHCLSFVSSSFFTFLFLLHDSCLSCLSSLQTFNGEGNEQEEKEIERKMCKWKEAKISSPDNPCDFPCELTRKSEARDKFFLPTKPLSLSLLLSSSLFLSLPLSSSSSCLLEFYLSHLSCVLPVFASKERERIPLRGKGKWRWWKRKNVAARLWRREWNPAEGKIRNGMKGLRRKRKNKTKRDRMTMSAPSAVDLLLGRKGFKYQRRRWRSFIEREVENDARRVKKEDEGEKMYWEERRRCIKRRNKSPEEQRSTFREKWSPGLSNQRLHPNHMGIFRKWDAVHKDAVHKEKKSSVHLQGRDLFCVLEGLKKLLILISLQSLLSPLYSVVQEKELSVIF